MNPPNPPDLPRNTTEPAPAAGVGARLRAAREAAGMSLEQASQQLKLAPRQVKALEDDEFALLPGRTFTRGFVRNYARLLNLDADALLLHLPDAAHAPALESPTLQSTGTRMAELPTAASNRLGFARWLIPLALVACIVAAAGYEWYRGRGIPSSETSRPASKNLGEPPAGPRSPNETLLPNPLTPGPATPASGGAGTEKGAVESATSLAFARRDATSLDPGASSRAGALDHRPPTRPGVARPQHR